MKIESSSIRMDSVKTFGFASTRKLGIGYTADNLPKGAFSDTYETAQNSLEHMSSPLKTRVYHAAGTQDSGRESPIENFRQQFVLYLWRILFGEDSSKKLADKYGLTTDNTTPATSYAPSVIHLYGIEEQYTLQEQNVQFTSSGNVTTADGRSIDINISISMSSRFEQYYRREGIEPVTMCDPLVMNFSGDVASLSDQSFFFDLDNDGTDDEISMPGEGNGFLALDKNGDGVINNGSELFGTKSGDGFYDLSAYDFDQNGWIDENDSVFDKLKIWYKDPSGNDKLMSLKDTGVGAIYLGHADTDFELRNASTGRINGAIRQTGIFLYENATLGSIVHMDIAKA